MGFTTWAAFQIDRIEDPTGTNLWTTRSTVDLSSERLAVLYPNCESLSRALGGV